MKELVLILLVTYFVGHHLFLGYAILKRRTYIRLKAAYYVLGFALSAAWLVAFGQNLYGTAHGFSLIFGCLGFVALVLDTIASLNRLFPPAVLWPSPFVKPESA